MKEAYKICIVQTSHCFLKVPRLKTPGNWQVQISMETNPKRMKTQRENCVKCSGSCVISLPTVVEVNLAYFLK